MSTPLTSMSGQQKKHAHTLRMAHRFLRRRAQIIEFTILSMSIVSTMISLLILSLGGIYFLYDIPNMTILQHAHWVQIIISWPIASIFITLSSMRIFSWFIENTCLKQKLQRTKEEAAIAQEEIDCMVLDIPWPKHLEKDPLDKDVVCELAKKAKKIIANLGDLETSHIPKQTDSHSNLTRVKYLMSNLKWDSTLQKCWQRCSTAFSFIVYTSLVTFLFFIHYKPGVDFTLNMLPFLPLLILIPFFTALQWVHLGIYFTDGKRIDAIYRQLSTDRSDGDLTNFHTRTIQDAIFWHRCTSPTIPEWFSRIHMKITKHSCPAKGHANCSSV